MRIIPKDLKIPQALLDKEKGAEVIKQIEKGDGYVVVSIGYSTKSGDEMPLTGLPIAYKVYDSGDFELLPPFYGIKKNGGKWSQVFQSLFRP